jgi:hypothetical protein
MSNEVQARRGSDKAALRQRRNENGRGRLLETAVTSIGHVLRNLGQGFDPGLFNSNQANTQIKKNKIQATGLGSVNYGNTLYNCESRQTITQGVHCDAC